VCRPAAGPQVRSAVALQRALLLVSRLPPPTRHRYATQGYATLTKVMKHNHCLSRIQHSWKSIPPKLNMKIHWADGAFKFQPSPWSLRPEESIFRPCVRERFCILLEYCIKCYFQFLCHLVQPSPPSALCVIYDIKCRVLWDNILHHNRHVPNSISHSYCLMLKLTFNWLLNLLTYTQRENSFPWESETPNIQ
jgi:hypothetical protein